MHLGRRRRLREARRFGGSLRERVERAIADLDASIARDRHFFAWFIVPMAVATLLSLPADGRRALGVVFVQTAAWLLAWSVTRWELRARSLPRRHRLARLRDELARGPAPTDE